MIANLNIEIRPRQVKLHIDKSTAVSFCENVLNILNSDPHCQNVMSFLGACFLYNKLRAKTGNTIRLKLPLEYGIMILQHCKNAFIYHEMERIALYIIGEQLDKQINITNTIKF